jgi:hypothetical protein
MTRKQKSVVYELSPNVDSYRAEDARVEGEFAGTLPRAHCPKCDEILVDQFAAYPCIDVTTVGELRKHLRLRTISLADFRRLASQVTAKIGRRIILLPCGALGPFIKAKAPTLVYDVEWCEPWLPLFRHTLVGKLAALGIRLDYAPVPIKVRGEVNRDYVMPQADPQRILASKTVEEQEWVLCEECGEVKESNPFLPPLDWLYLDRGGLVGNPQLFRDVNASGPILVSVELAQVLAELKPSGLALKEAGEWV